MKSKELSVCEFCFSMTYTVQKGKYGKCGKCGKRKLDEFKKALSPTGVSQWRNCGQRYGYWSYFEKEIRNNIIKKIEKWNESGYYSDCVGKHGWEDLIKIINHDS